MASQQHATDEYGEYGDKEPITLHSTLGGQRFGVGVGSGGYSHTPAI